MQNYKQSVNKTGLLVGLALFSLITLDYLAQFAGSQLYLWANPGATEYPVWLSWVLSFIPLYGVAFPVFCVILERVPRIQPRTKKLGFGNYLVILCISFCVLYIGAMLGNGLNYLIGLLRGSPVDFGLADILSGSSLWSTVLFTCILAPLGEETMFRKLLLERTLVYGEGQAILFTALCFALLHGNLYQFFYAFFVGIMLAYLRVRSGRLSLCIITHSLINLIGGVLSPMVLSASQRVIILYGLAIVALLITGAVFLCRAVSLHIRLAAGRPEAKLSSLYFNVFSILSWLFFLCIIVYTLLME